MTALINILIVIGIFFCPYFTIGCLLLQLDHPVLASISFILSFIVFFAEIIKKK